MENKTTLSSHVLDQTLGIPASNVPISLQKQNSEGTWETYALVFTDKNGRVAAGGFPPLLHARTYSLCFDTRSYFVSRSVSDFLFPEVSDTFEVREEDLGNHFHIPLLLSPYGYSTYRGS
eukprot:TRINITY_DN12444_c0_g1_i1.p1 TRINITY_DN12444_c0_g1~~TRINITY_DN12444_c0_g1_i1.p1  ORF type:complete len:120 (+),score=19.47 TRINITY_DN12444_c0_g1_i1:18-377(+)